MTDNITTVFKEHSVSEHADSVADYLPPGIMFEGGKIQGTNLRALLLGLANELFRAEDLLKQTTEQYLPDCTVSFLDEWESAVGIPDDCFSGNGTEEERRRDILAKLAASGVQTAQDFVDLAAIFGITVTITPGIEIGNVFPMTFPFTFLFTSIEQARCTMVVTFVGEPAEVFPYTFPISFSPGLLAGSEFPLTFPFTFGSGVIGIVECLFRKLKPANCDIIFLQT